MSALNIFLIILLLAESLVFIFAATKAFDIYIASQDRHAKEIETLWEELRSANNKLVYQLTMMKKEGFQTVPDDEEWPEPVRLTSEYEADIEEARNRNEA